METIAILDTSYFIKLKPLDSSTTYFTTEFIVKELKDEKARHFYKLNEEFIKIRNPEKAINKFAKAAGDLNSLSIPDISILALTYELYIEKGLGNQIRKEPIKYEIEKVELQKHEKEKTKKAKEDFNWDDYDSDIKTIGGEENKSSEEQKEFGGENIVKVENVEEILPKIQEPLLPDKENTEDDKNNDVAEGDEEDWITIDNIEKKLHQNTFLKDETTEAENKIVISIYSSDFALQNLSLKMGFAINSIDGIRITRIKNYILKCYSCNTLNFDTSKLFCEFCGYNTLMKVGYYVSDDGKVIIRDKDAEARLRGTQFNLPNPTLDKKGKVYILAEDQLPKRRIDVNLEKNFDKLIDNYFQYKDLLIKNNDVKPQNSSKNYVWGYPKKNPNEAKKYYSKKSKK